MKRYVKMAVRSQSSGAAVVVRRAGSHRAGSLAGWAWCEARQAMQFGKRQGAHCVEFRPNNVRFFLRATNSGVATMLRGKQGGPKSPASPAAPPRRHATSSLDIADPPGAALSKRKQRTQQQLLLWQHRQKVRGLWRRALLKVVKEWRFRRMWSVHNAWYATCSASAASAGPPTLAFERMDVVDSSADRAVSPAEQQPAARVVGELRAEASEFSPGLPMAGVEAAWFAAVDALVAATARLDTPVAPDALDLANELRLIKADRERFVSQPGYRAAGHASSSSDAGSSDTAITIAVMAMIRRARIRSVGPRCIVHVVAVRVRGSVCRSCACAVRTRGSA